MAIGQIKPLGWGQLAASNTTLCTGASSKITVVRDLQFCNINASSTTYTLYYVPNGGSAGNSTTLFKNRTLAGKQTDGFRFVLPLEAGATVVAVANDANYISYQISGTEYDSAMPGGWVPTRFVQAIAPSGSLTSQYTVASGKRIVIKDIIVAEIGNTTPTFDIAVVRNGETLANKHYWYYNYALTAYSSISTGRASFVAQAGDDIRIKASGSTQVTITLNGVLWTVTS